MSDFVDEEFDKARHALADADRLREADGSTEGIANRLYYACVHGAQAVGIDRGFEPRSHGAVVRLFGREVVKADDAQSEDGRLLNELRNLRTEPDYGYDELEVDIEALRTDVSEFFDAMAELIE